MNAGELPEVMATAGGCGLLPARPAGVNMMENARSILIVIFPFNSYKPRPQTESCVFSSLACMDFLFIIRRTLWHIHTQKWPISHCAANFWICQMFHESLQSFKWMEFLVRPLNKGLVPIHYKYFVRYLTLHHFLLSPKVWNIRVSINLTDLIICGCKSYRFGCWYWWTAIAVTSQWLWCHPCCIVSVKFYQKLHYW